MTVQTAHGGTGLVGQTTTSTPPSGTATTNLPAFNPKGSAPSYMGTAAQNNAFTYMQQVLKTYGLGSLSTWAWNEIVSGASADKVLLDLQQTTAFKTRFPAIALRQAKGLNAISPADYINYENQVFSAAHQAGLPHGFVDEDTITKMLTSDVSANEATERINGAKTIFYTLDHPTQQALMRDYNLKPGQFAAMWLDPAKAEPLLLRDLAAAQIGGSAIRAGYHDTRSIDEQLAKLGLNPDQAGKGFTDLESQQQLFNPLVGQREHGIGQSTQIQAEFLGDAAAQQQIEARRAQRLAQFQEGGSFLGGQASGTAGLGTAKGA